MPALLDGDSGPSFCQCRSNCGGRSEVLELFRRWTHLFSIAVCLFD